MPANFVPQDARDRRASDNTRVARVRRGDQDAFEAIVLEFQPELHAYVTRWTGSEAMAWDVLQQLFLHIWTTRERWEIPHGLRPYLYAAARGYVLRYLRTERRLAVREAVYAEDQQTIAVGEADAHDDLIAAARRAVEQLPERSREIWRLCREQGLTYPEAAAVLGVSVNTVKTLLGRALRSVRAALVPWLSLMLWIGK